MAIILDLILLTLTVFVASYIGAYFLPLNLPLRLILSALITVVCVSAIRKIFYKPAGNRMSYRQYVTHLIWQGEDYAKDIIAQLCDGKREYRDMGEYLLIDGIAVFVWTKYSAISADTSVKFYRICKHNGYKKAYILTTNGDKKTASLVKNFGDIILIYSSFKGVYKSVKKADLLPQDSKMRVPAKQILYMIFQTAFTRKNGFRFIGVSLLLLLLSFVTPFANYYIAIASVNLALAIVSMIVSLKNS